MTCGIRSARQLYERGGTLDAFDLVWLDEDDEVVRRVSEDPRLANTGGGGVFTAACKQGKRELVVRLLEAGARVAPTLTACRSYLLTDPDLLRLLLAGGMNHDLPNWQLATPLYDLCGRDSRAPSASAPDRMRIDLARFRGKYLGTGRRLSLDPARLGRPQRPA